MITQVHRATEFYGISRAREPELESLSKRLTQFYNDPANDQSLNVELFIENMACVIQQGDKYHRVMIK